MPARDEQDRPEHVESREEPNSSDPSGIDEALSSEELPKLDHWLDEERHWTIDGVNSDDLHR